MKIAIIIILIILAYGIIGYAFALCLAAYAEDDLDADPVYIEMGICWILALPLTLIFLISKFFGKKLAVILIAIMALIRAKKDEGEE